MKKQFALFLLIFFGWAILPTQNVNAQTRLGYKAAEVRSEFTKLGFTVSADYTVIDGVNTYVQSIKFEDRSVIYYYTPNMVCYACAVIPDNLYARNKLIQRYNSNPEYIKESDTHWKWYSTSGNVFDIRLISTEKDGYFFWWE